MFVPVAALLQILLSISADTQQDEQGDKIPDVEIAVDSSAYGIVSDSLGHYELGYMAMNEDYTITPYKYSDPQEGLVDVRPYYPG